jgi:hypothetical protein
MSLNAHLLEFVNGELGMIGTTYQKTDITHMKSLGRYLNDEGRVDYAKIQNDLWLFNQLTKIQFANPWKMEHQEAFAFWINAYNLLTIKGVLDRLKKDPEWKGVLGLWTKYRFFVGDKHLVAGKRFSLSHIEHKILRNQFQDPRLHFAINCASSSCPVLYDRLFRGDSLDSWLDTVVKNFVNNDAQVRYDPVSHILWVNPIFKWYKKDFAPVGGIRVFINKYLDKSLVLPHNLKIRYFSYDWSLNSQ